MLRVGIIGLPNVGKSTLFNALTHQCVPAENFPFCTIEPNTAIINVPDARLTRLAEATNCQQLMPATIEFVDIAGLVRGAHQGVGLGNEFLAHVRGVDLIVHVVRAFEDASVLHVENSVDPERDLQIVHDELLMADLAVIDKHRIAAKSRVRNTNDKEAGKMFDILDRLWRAMRDEKKNASDIGLSVEEILLLRPFGFLTLKPVLFVVNVGESGPFDAAMWTQRLGGNAVPVCIRGEAELADIVNIQEREDFRAQLGMGGSLDWVIRGCYESLGLRTFYTFGKGITRAWPVYPGATAIDAAGMIHTDFLQTFSRAQILSFNDLCAHGEQYVRDRGLFQTVGRNYELCDGDVVWIVADTI